MAESAMLRSTLTASTTDNIFQLSIPLCQKRANSRPVTEIVTLFGTKNVCSQALQAEKNQVEQELEDLQESYIRLQTNVSTLAEQLQHRLDSVGEFLTLDFFISFAADGLRVLQSRRS